MSNVVIKVAEFHKHFPAIQAIRQSVFQKGQGVDPALDFDGLDEVSEQLIASLDDQYVGTARIRYLDEKTAKIERLAVLPIARGQGIGKKIMEKALEIIASNNIPEAVIHAQEYVKSLHQQLGFQVTVQGGNERMRVRGNLIGWFALVTSNLVSVERGRR